MQKLGLIAGGGSLPVEIAEHCQRSGRPLFVIRLKGFAGAGLEPFAGAEVGLAELGKCFKALKRAGCRAVCLAGQVNRPDFATLMLTCAVWPPCRPPSPQPERAMTPCSACWSPSSRRKASRSKALTR